MEMAQKDDFWFLVAMSLKQSLILLGDPMARWTQSKTATDKLHNI